MTEKTPTTKTKRNRQPPHLMDEICNKSNICLLAKSVCVAFFSSFRKLDLFKQTRHCLTPGARHFTKILVAGAVMMAPFLSHRPNSNRNVNCLPHQTVYFTSIRRNHLLCLLFIRYYFYQSVMVARIFFSSFFAMHTYYISLSIYRFVVGFT